MSADVTPIRPTTMSNTHGQRMSFLGFASALFDAPSALLERGRLARRARTSSIPPAPPAPAREINVASQMKVTRTDTATECRLQLEGILTVDSAPELRALFDSVVAAQPLRVILDLDQLTMLDSSGVGAIVSLFKRVKAASGSIVVIGLQNQPLAVCKLLKLDRLFGL